MAESFSLPDGESVHFSNGGAESLLQGWEHIARQRSAQPGMRQVADYLTRVLEVDIYESSPVVKELGVGVNILPHAVRELTEIGLLNALYDVGIPTAEWVLYSKHGQRIWGESRGLDAGYHWPQISIHRGQLLGLLYRAVGNKIGLGRIHTGHHLANFGQDDNYVWSEFIQPVTGSPAARVESDLLVGCDGIHSAVRQALYPDEGPPRWNGIVMWRGITDGKPFLSGRTMILAGYFGRRIVVYPISKRHEDDGGALINWVAEHKCASAQAMPKQDWSHFVRLEEVLDPFASFAFDFLDTPNLIRNAQVIYQYPMVDRDPLPAWHFGRVTLLGDAAHPMYPVGSNGATQAIIDARVLARELALHPSVQDALAAYDAARRPATAAIVQANRDVGPEHGMDIVHARAPHGYTDIDDVISHEELAEISHAYKRIAGFDPETLNNRSSLSVR